MKVIYHIDGVSYVGESVQVTHGEFEKYKKEFYEGINSFTCIQAELENGSVLFINKEILKKTLFELVP